MTAVVAHHPRLQGGRPIIGLRPTAAPLVCGQAGAGNIRCWCDRNGNGVSDPGEVMDLADCGVVGISVTPDSAEDGTLRATRGVRLADGRYRPTWDWTPAPAADARPALAPILLT